MNKKGYAYFVEIILAVLIVIVVLQGFIESKQQVFSYKQQEDLRVLGWNILKNLDELGVLDSALNEKNFTKIEIYVQESLDELADFDLEYYNTSCYSVDGGVLSSGSTICNSINISGEYDVVSTYYTFGGNLTPQTIKIYLWRKLS